MSYKIECELVEHIAILSTSPSGWTKEVNLLSWNGAAAVYDIRSWAPDRQRAGKGVTLNQDEMGALLTVLQDRKAGGMMRQDGGSDGHGGRE